MMDTALAHFHSVVRVKTQSNERFRVWTNNWRIARSKLPCICSGCVAELTELQSTSSEGVPLVAVFSVRWSARRTTQAPAHSRPWQLIFCWEIGADLNQKLVLPDAKLFEWKEPHGVMLQLNQSIPTQSAWHYYSSVWLNSVCLPCFCFWHWCQKQIISTSCTHHYTNIQQTQNGAHRTNTRPAKSIEPLSVWGQRARDWNGAFTVAEIRLPHCIWCARSVRIWPHQNAYSVRFCRSKSWRFVCAVWVCVSVFAVVFRSRHRTIK